MFRVSTANLSAGLLATLTAMSFAGWSLPAQAQKFSINTGCPVISEADMGSMSLEQLRDTCYGKDSTGGVLNCGQHRTMAAAARIDVGSVENQAAEQVVADGCPSEVADEELPINAEINAIPNGSYAFVRGYFGSFSGSKASVCSSNYSGEAIIQDGFIRFVSGGHSWQGVITEDRYIYITRDGVTNPRPKNDTAIIGPVSNAKLSNGYCGDGYFRLFGL